LLTKEVASIVRRPVRVRRSMSSVFICVGTRNFSFWRPSRGETSTMRIEDMARKRWITGMEDVEEKDVRNREEEERNPFRRDVNTEIVGY
jgi:hypothetical protein